MRLTWNTGLDTSVLNGWKSDSASYSREAEKDLFLTGFRLTS